MKKLLLSFSVALFALSATAQAGYVKGYTRKDGTYVAPYYRGGGSSAPSYTPAPSYPAPAPVVTSSATQRITTYPAIFKGKPCGKSFIAQEKQCLADSPRRKLADFANCTEAWENGVTDIPRNSPAFSEKLDRDHDGIACEVSDMYNGTTWMYGIEDEILNSSTEFIAADTLAALGFIPPYMSETVALTVGDKTITFKNGETITREGYQLAAAPFMKWGDLMVPLKSVEILGCKFSTTPEQYFEVNCPNGTQLAGNFVQRK